VNTDQLIERLTGELTPVSRRLSSAQRATLWFAVALLCVAIGLAHFGVRRDSNMLRSVTGSKRRRVSSKFC